VDSTPATSPSRRIVAFASVLVALAAVVPYLQALDFPFLHDDRWALVDNPNTQGDVDLGRILTTNAWGDVAGMRHIVNYRPLSTLSLAVTRAVWDLDPLPYRAFDLAAHALASVLLLLLGLRLGLGIGPMGLAALAFAVHPVHAEAVLFAVNREETLATAAVLGLLLIAVRRSGLVAPAARRPWTPASLAGLGALLALGLLCKETAATAVPAIALVALLWPATARRWRESVPPIAASLAVLAAYVALRLFALGRLFAEVIPWQDNPLVRADTAGRWSGALAVQWEAFLLLIAPLRLSVDYGWNVLDLPEAGFPLRAVTGLLVVAAVATGFIATVRRRPPLAFGLLVLACGWSIVSNLLFPGSILLAERLLYLPSAGAALALVAAVPQSLPTTARAGRWVRLAGLAIAAAWIGLLGLRSWDRAADFRTAESLFATSLAQRPGSSRLHVNLGVALQDDGRWTEAEPQFRRALAIDPQDAEAHNNLGLCLANAGRASEAARSFVEALRIRPGFPSALGNLCLLLESAGSQEAALDWCEKAVRHGAPVDKALQRLRAGGQSTWKGDTRP
jgi:tetratricopeptide (TPR) repeat protein